MSIVKKQKHRTTSPSLCRRVGICWNIYRYISLKNKEKESIKRYVRDHIRT